MNETLHSVENGDGEDASLVWNIAHLGVTPGEAVTFSPDHRGNFGKAWDIWLEECFSPVLAPAFIEIYQRAANFQVNEIADVDRELSEKLSSSHSKKSIQAAAAFLEGKSEMKHHPEWKRFIAKIESGKTPGHTLTLATLQSVLYHLPLASALIAYARFEFICGLNGMGKTILDNEQQDEIFSRVLPKVKVAVQQKVGEIQGSDDGNPGFLRAI